MKLKLLFSLLLLCSLSAFGQNITYKIEWVRPDSLLLVEFASQFLEGTPRVFQELKTERPFRDTAEISAFIGRFDSELRDVQAELQKAKVKHEFLSQRAAAANALRNSGLYGWGLNPKEAIVNPPVKATVVKPKSTTAAKPPKKPAKKKGQ